MSDLRIPGAGVWPTEPLGALCDIVIGRTPSRSRPELWGDDYAWLSIADMNQGGRIRFTKEKISSLGVAESGSRLIPSGTVLLSFKLSIGKVALSEIDTFTNEAIAALPIRRPDKLVKNFLFWALRTIRLDVEVDVAAKGKTLNKSKLERLEIPLPPIAEQTRIAALLDKADALRCLRKESLKLAEKLLQASFIDMFVRNPDAANWMPQSIEWMAKDGKGAIRTGPFGSQLLHSEFVDHGIAVLGIDNAVKNRFAWGQPRFITPEKYERLKRYRVLPGDLIITIMGTLGRCAIVPADIPESINTKHLCCITLDREKCLPEFLHAAFLNHPDVLRQLGVRAKGAVMPGLNMGIIKDLELPLPPIQLQKEFKRIVAVCTTLRADLEDFGDAAERLFASMQQHAFRGQLDLSRLKLSTEAESLKVAPALESGLVEGRYTRPGSFIAPPEIEAQMMKLEEKLASDSSDSIDWNENYFKYRTLGQLLRAPFSFTQIWDEVYYDMPEASYEVVRGRIFDYVEDGSLEQRFDEARKEIVFYPRA